MALSAGARLGPYEVLSVLGAGGKGEVYKARDTRLDRTVAIKVLPEPLASDPSRVRTLMNSVGKSTNRSRLPAEPAHVHDTRQIVLGQMADHKLDALVYETFDHQPGEISSSDMRMNWPRITANHRR